MEVRVDESGQTSYSCSIHDDNIDHIHDHFFLEHAGELRIIILRRKRAEPVQHHHLYTPEMIQVTSAAIEKINLSRPRLVLPTWELCHQEGNPLGSSQLPSFFLLLSLG
jgi:hypothetical protein